MNHTMSDVSFGAADENASAEGDARPPPGHFRAKIAKAIQELGYHHDTWRVFSDFVELIALTISVSFPVKHTV